MKAWEEFLTAQEKALGKETVQKWLRPLKTLRFDACNLYLEAEDAFKAVWFEEHIRHKAQAFLCNNNNKKIKVHISVAASFKPEVVEVKKVATVPPFRLNYDALDEKCRFDTFLPCESNLLAYKLMQEAGGIDAKSGQLLKEAPPVFNPIYLFGRSGTGKTHLLMSVAHALKQRGKKALYVRAETFTEHVVNAIRSGEMQTFRKAYRHFDALLIDDIEIFGKKAATQEEFFHTFNTLHVATKQIILTASLLPGELKYIEPRLISRFEWGIVVPIQRLPQEKLSDLLFQKSAELNFPLSEEVAEFLLKTFSANTKSLLRALDALHLRSHLNRPQALTLPLVTKLLSDLIHEEEKALLTPAKVLRTVSEHYGIKMDDILSKSQNRECVLPRQLAMHLCRELLHLPYMKIGDIFSRDHSTVMTSVKQIQKSLEEHDPDLTQSCQSIVKKLGG